MRILRTLLTLVSLMAALTFWVVPATGVANTFACCLPDGSCQDLILTACEAGDGVSLPSNLCQDNPCNPEMVPVVSFPVMVLIAITLLTFAIYTLMRRATRE